MTKKSLDLTKLLPKQYRDKTLDTILKNLFERHISKSDTVPLYGTIGDGELAPGEIKLNETSLERQINQITSLIYAEHATEKKIFSWPDLVQKLVLLGVDYSSIGDWFSTGSYNFVPPINLDKFCNFNEYFWVGGWLQKSPNLNYSALGIPAIEVVTDAFVRTNSKYTPEYYTIARGDFDSNLTPIAPTPNLKTWSDWSLTNLWVHKQDVINFLNSHGNGISFSDLKQATRPIIEYPVTLRLNTCQNAQGEPIESINNNRIISKTHSNQPPLFDLYTRDGAHYGKASAIFYYVEGSQYPVDSIIQRRVATDVNNNYIFEHSLVDSDTDELLFFKQWDVITGFNLKTIWVAGPNVDPSYVKYDDSGTLINQDKFTNFKNYYWTALPGDLPTYNPTAEPEYTVVEQGNGLTDWSRYNKWVHVSALKRNQISGYIQASRPIIEFNKFLEAEITQQKWYQGQLPQFKLYAYDKVANEYLPVRSTVDPSLTNLNDAYLNGEVFVRLNDLSAELKQAILLTSELLAKTLTANDELYLQGLDTGMFVSERDGNVYGYHADIISFLAEDKGEVTSLTIDPICVPEVITLTYDLATNLFNVTGSVSGQNPDLIPSSEYYSNTGLKFTVTVGNKPFEHEDKIIINVKSYVFEQANTYVKVGTEYRTLTSPAELLTENVEITKVKATPENFDGVWEVPPQLEWNVQNETRSQLTQGDLYSHFISIIKSQESLVGSETGNNNFRSLTDINLGFGGIIKQYDGSTALLISLLIQEGITVPAIIEFARQSYESLFSYVHKFIEEVIPELLTNVKFSPPVEGDTSIDPLVLAQFKDYFLSATTAKFPDLIDKTMQSVFIDSTSSLSGLVVTLPYLGLCGTDQPRTELDLELNLPMIIHHDGHRSQVPQVNVDLLKAYITKKFVRLFGQETPGFVTPVDFPKDPFKGQFWFQTSTNKLFFYNVVSETGELPEGAEVGAYSVDRETQNIWQYNGTWNQLGIYEMDEPWTEVRLDIIEQNIILALEKELYESCPPVTPRLQEDVLQANRNFEKNMKLEFERFGVTYGTPDVYGSVYNSVNAFTWNYFSFTGKEQTWAEIYRGAYGTPRPDLQPWIPAGYAAEHDLLNDLSAHGLISGNMVEWKPSLWTFSAIAEFIRAAYILQGRPAVLSVDTFTGALLPPYSVYSEGFYKTVPASASDSFNYGGMGPIETYWRKTLNYLYSLQKVYFKLDPLGYVDKTWGVRQDTVGGYKLNSSLGYKEAPKDFQLHGDVIPALTASAQLEKDTKINSLITVTILNYPEFNSVYRLKYVNRLDNIFAIYRNETLQGFVKTGVIYTDDYITLFISNKLTNFYWGDSFTVNVNTDGIPIINHATLANLHIEGLNQLYVQYRRLYGEDVNLSINQTLLKNWEVRAGYRVGSLVNTDTLKITSQNEVVDPSTYQVIIKENKFYDSVWLNALKLQLVQKGSVLNGVPRVGPGGSPGEDWIFRVDNFNDARTELSWYQLNTRGPASDFIVLNGKISRYAWNHYTEKVNLVTHQAPFLIKGIQNVVNFLFGYEAKLTDDGWRFNDQDNPVLDSTTGRPLGFQLLIEQFINQQFLGVDAGSTFVINPFYRKVWLSTPRGVVADLYGPLGIEQETTCTIFDQQQRPIAKNELRVFRQDEITEIVFDKPAYTLHLMVSEFEHVILFDNYAVSTMLINDSFLGQRANSIFLSGEKQETFTGRLDLGGHFVLGDQMKRNIENSVENILKMYDTAETSAPGPDMERARSLLGFQKKSYFTDRGSTDATEFRFWQGMIANKGTNFAVDAYVNSSQFKSAKLDEYWAYKLADYGDARTIKKVELKVNPEDCSTDHAKYLLLENDELSLIKEYKRNGGFDVSSLGITTYDVDTLYTEKQSLGFDYVDPTGCTLIRPDDETRWFKYNDLHQLEYFEAAVLAEYNFVADSLDKVYTIYDAKGKLVRADCFEIVDLSNPELPSYYEMGSISDSDPFDMGAYDMNLYDQLTNIVDPDYDAPVFKRLNHHTIQILDPILLNRPLKVIAYGPAFSRFSPLNLIDYRSNVMTKNDIIWWDPARGIHHPEAINEIDYESEKNPAKYNQSLVTFKNSSVELMKPWGEEQLGKLWWNTKNLSYQPYSDTKIVNDVNERVARWGSVSDSSSVEVYEWVKSTLSPQDYEKDPTTDGDIAIKDAVTRTRVWYQRPVAWKFSANPFSQPRSFSAYQPSRLKIEVMAGISGRAIMNTGDFNSIITRDCKLAGAIYSSQQKTDLHLTSIFGTAKITSDPYVVIGDSVDYTSGGKFIPNKYFTISADIDQRVIGFRKKNYLGQYKLSSEQDGNDFYIRLTHAVGETQRIRVHDLPVLANTQDTYNFDYFGIIITCTSNLSRDDLVGMNELTRQQHAALMLSLGHEIYLRSTVDVEILVPFTNDDNLSVIYLDGALDISRTGWIAWKDPDVNPNKGLEPPLNRYEPFVGPWTPILGHLADLATDITTRVNDPWTWFDGTDYNPYKNTWTPWTKLEDTIREVDYFLVNESHEDYIINRFTYEDLSRDELKERASIYVNEIKLLPAQWSTATRLNGPFVVGSYPVLPYLNPGDRLKVILHPIVISEDDLKFDPTVDDNLFKLVQYKIDYPHVLEYKRDQNDRFSLKNYYFWVKNKLEPSKIKSLSSSNVAQLLHHHDGVYSIPQIFKQYNQVDGRPNRYGMIMVHGLNQYVSELDMYKLRFIDNGTLRNTDSNLSLKNHHVEWVLLRAAQASRIPLTLWDKLTDTLIAKTADGRTLLPFTPLLKYDDRNDTNDRYGFDDGQIMNDVLATIATIKYTIQNTRVDKYEGANLVPDYISYDGFDINNLDNYFFDPATGKVSEKRIRQFMSDLWRFAKPKQINEIFFAVLEDTAAKNLEISNFFKTSFISIGEIRTAN